MQEQPSNDRIWAHFGLERPEDREPGKFAGTPEELPSISKKTREHLYIEKQVDLIQGVVDTLQELRRPSLPQEDHILEAILSERCDDVDLLAVENELLRRQLSEYALAPNRPQPNSSFTLEEILHRKSSTTIGGASPPQRRKSSLLFQAIQSGSRLSLHDDFEIDTDVRSSSGRTEIAQDPFWL
eukprot:m.305677 g.305677  ORF g.305677 m.305677 type:complete len:184 (+) comp18137_c0_seq1:198-749(+)